MSTTILEVMESAGYDIRNNVDDARWFLGQDLDELVEMADELVEEYEDWEAAQEAIEKGRFDFPSFEEWRKEKDDGRD